MMKREFLRSREVKEFSRMVFEQWGAVPELFDKVVFVKSKDKIYIVNRDIERLDLGQLRINSYGIYIAELKNTQVRLSIEGSQLVGPVATKNIHEISESQLKDWLRGLDLSVDGNYDGFVILKCNGDFVGSGKFRDGVVFNYVPKARRLLDIH
ncbi:hypothetical protein D6825_03675 [Candidatus Woesearchaeota archaeon]|nr:MAG: hypothetical protein D6825_03675 [Candidatus Woesearchaeota archaeon]